MPPKKGLAGLVDKIGTVLADAAYADPFDISGGVGRDLDLHLAGDTGRQRAEGTIADIERMAADQYAQRKAGLAGIKRTPQKYINSDLLENRVSAPEDEEDRSTRPGGITWLDQAKFQYREAHRGKK